MAIGWMTILSNVPWSDVISNAPAVADGARKLWKKVASRASTATNTPVSSSGATPEEQIANLQVRVDELHAQMLAASEVVQSLAEQNAQLIARVETNRRRMLALLICNVGVVVFAIITWLR
ncbi:hypothetical protein [Azonexus sp.]|uniref:hypothetical protein n=1 Tax=Azonexus sp. TaxID=1872668 RepID=UPI0027B99631|nr:hypothetical protein [Azonexus sp.]